ncbi:MAG: hypothetical protein ACE5QF_06365 [Thermoplasmata archaeon]
MGTGETTKEAESPEEVSFVHSERAMRAGPELASCLGSEVFSVYTGKSLTLR